MIASGLHSSGQDGFNERKKNPARWHGQDIFLDGFDGVWGGTGGEGGGDRGSASMRRRFSFS